MSESTKRLAPRSPLLAALLCAVGGLGSARAEGGPRVDDLMLKWPDVNRAFHIGLYFGPKHKT